MEYQYVFTVGCNRTRVSYISILIIICTRKYRRICIPIYRVHLVSAVRRICTHHEIFTIACKLTRKETSIYITGWSICGIVNYSLGRPCIGTRVMFIQLNIEIVIIIRTRNTEIVITTSRNKRRFICMIIITNSIHGLT